MIDQKQLLAECKKLKLKLTQIQVDKFELYARILVEWNEKVNLTAITAPNEIVTKHFVDSLALLYAYPLPHNARIIDVGTGAGFPSVPVKIVRNDIDLTLLDSLNKRITFLKELSQMLEQDNQCIHMRAEDAGHNINYREQFDVATARAVAHLRELSEYCLPFVKKEGYFIALKSGEIEEELSESKKAIHLLGGKIEAIRSLMLQDGSKRSVVLIKKISQTSTKYPRPHAKIAKNPLI